MKVNKFFSKKFTTQALVLMLLTMGITLFSHVNAKADTSYSPPDNVKQVGSTSFSVTVSWDPYDYANEDCYYCISKTSTLDTSNVYRAPGYLNTLPIDTIDNQLLQSGETYYVWVGATEKGNGYHVNWPTQPIAVVTNPTKVKQFEFLTDVTKNSLSFTWDGVYGATGYKVDYSTDGKQVSTTLVSKNSVTLTGLKSNANYSVTIYPFRSNGGPSDYMAVCEDGDLLSGITFPEKITNLKCTNFNPSLNVGKAKFSWDVTESAYCYQYEVYTYNGNKRLFKGESDYGKAHSVSVSNKLLQPNQMYKVRIRGMLFTQTGTCYTGWSDFTYFSRCASNDVNVQKSKGKIKTTWAKVNGASGYYVYMSNKANTGYTLVTTTKKTSALINQKIKANKNYYLRVVPYYNNKGTINTAPINSSKFYSADVYTAKNGWRISH
jgi:hypothetical protein